MVVVNPRRHDDLVSGCKHAPGHCAGEGAVVGAIAALGPDHVLDRHPRVDEVAVGGDVDAFQMGQQRTPLIPRHVRRGVGDIVPGERRHRDECDIGDVEFGREIGEFEQISSNPCCDQPTRSILFTQIVRCGIPRSVERNACRRVCSRTPLRASMRMIARSAVDAPVTMLPGYAARARGCRR